jgi:hypothetical protein
MPDNLDPTRTARQQSPVRRFHDALLPLLAAVHRLGELRLRLATLNPAHWDAAAATAALETALDDAESRYLELCRVAAALSLPRPPDNDTRYDPAWSRRLHRWCMEAMGMMDATADGRLQRFQQHRDAQPGNGTATRGAPQRYDEDADAKLVKDWKAAKRQDASRADFCRRRGIDLEKLIHAQQRVKYRDNRDRA